MHAHHDDDECQREEEQAQTVTAGMAHVFHQISVCKKTEEGKTPKELPAPDEVRIQGVVCGDMHDAHGNRERSSHALRRFVINERVGNITAVLRDEIPKDNAAAVLPQ